MFQSYQLYANDILVLAISSTLIPQHTISVYIHVLIQLLSFELSPLPQLNNAYKETKLCWHIPNETGPTLYTIKQTHLYPHAENFV